jgi:hypothetical protein
MTPLLLLIADVSGTGHPSDVTAGAVLTLVLPLALLAIVLTWWWLAARRGWPKLPVARRQAPAAQAPAPPAPVPQAPVPRAPASQREPPRRDGDA